ncbi:potassium channel AKT1-like [Abeliophyllum distichum]|uniref:Potassium channel AKT1-like n=1 Tax=Abeliophyllum distichum TaxID=126358 RepID=A0ABD1U1N3_9LAMI
MKAPPGAPPLAHNFPAMETPPTTTPSLVPISLAPSSAPHLNSLVCGPNLLWGQPSWVSTPTLAEKPPLSLEQRLEDMMGHKIAEAMSKKCRGMGIFPSPLGLATPKNRARVVLGCPVWGDATKNLVLLPGFLQELWDIRNLDSILPKL